MSGATSAPCISYGNRAAVCACVGVQMVECRVQARLPPFLVVVIFGNRGYSLVRGFLRTSERNYGD